MSGSPLASGILRGAGHTRTPMVVHLIGFWILGLPLGAWLTLALEVGPTGPWWGLVAGLGIGATVLVWQVRKRLQKPVGRVHIG